MPIKVIVEGLGDLEFPDDTPDAVIEATVKRELAAGSSASEAGPVTPASGLRKVAELALDWAPTIGGMAGGVGGLAAGPGAIVASPVLAAMGGAAGSGVKMLGETLLGKREAPGALEQAQEAGIEAAKQGVSQLGGQLAGKGLQFAGKRLYSGLLKPAKALRESFGGSGAIAETALQQRIPISTGGLEKVTGRLGGSRAKALELVRAADEAGSTSPKAAEIIREFEPVVETLRKRADVGQASELARVGQRGKAIVKTMGRLPSLSRVQELKEAAQDAASGAYRTIQRGGAKQLSAEDLLDEATARGLRKSIEARVPGMAAQNAETQRLLGVTRALEDATQREAGNAMVGGMRDFGMGAIAGLAGGGPSGLAAASMGRLLSTPSSGSRAAIALYQAGKLPLAQLTQILQTEAEQSLLAPEK